MDPAAWTVLAGGLAAVLAAIAFAIRQAVIKPESPPTPPPRPPLPSADSSGTYPAVGTPPHGYPLPPGQVLYDRQTLDHMVSRFEAVMSRAEQPATHDDIQAIRADIQRLRSELQGMARVAEENRRGVAVNGQVNDRQDVELREHTRRLDKLELH